MSLSLNNTYYDSMLLPKQENLAETFSDDDTDIHVHMVTMPRIDEESPANVAKRMEQLSEVYTA